MRKSGESKDKGKAPVTSKPRKFRPKVVAESPSRPLRKKAMAETSSPRSSAEVEATKSKKRKQPPSEVVSPSKRGVASSIPSSSSPVPAKKIKGKKKAIEPKERYDSGRFPSPAHEKNYNIMFSGRPVLLERVFELPKSFPGDDLISMENNLACKEIWESIIVRQWTPLLAIKFTGYVDLVRKFYANLSTTEYISYVNISLCKSEGQWLESKRTEGEVRALIASSMCVKARLWWVFVQGILLPISHHYSITHTRLWCLKMLMENECINVGLTMAHEIIFLHKQNLRKGNLSYAGIISQLCINAGVSTEGLGAMKFSRPMSLKCVFGEPPTNIPAVGGMPKLGLKLMSLLKRL